ncbi:Zinc knuckle CX2CX4HX4C [Arabidopsis thaliana x Arabidopsis arenosa]|uniref:Zinc knuckle CX2CX4HX4C n=1 Tax=Arabidopsis thaliana x Arabidopsis arenosa TaxID=1240361 RepID=A0A8T2A907_9BRAS|nr:Zinc knuckle CX2CX4HX4C [Arabidopsis thaliana x Arabidopsis arenosa]
MADEIWQDLQYMVLGRDDPELFVPQAVYASVVASNRLSLIGRPLNLQAQNLRRVLSALPRTWGKGMAARVHGRILDDQCVQFRFRSESDLVSVLRRAPWLHNNWFVALQRWADFPGPDFLTFIDLWVQIAFIRVKVRINITDRLRFFRIVRFESREGAMIGFEYERLRRICTNCCRINHDISHCPYLVPHDAPNNEDNDEEVLEVHVWEEGAGSNITTPPPPLENQSSSSSSDISSYRPISQPANPVSPNLDLNQFVEEQQPIRFSTTSSSSRSGDNAKARYKIGESSKRKKRQTN